MSGTSLKGVLFLTAGYGTRAEPLSFARPKCLLPWKDTTLLGALVEQFARLEPEAMFFNASRCPELIIKEAVRNWGGQTKILFEERPLGTCGTLAENRAIFQGTWVICNTDFVMDIPAEALLQQHMSRGSHWTVLTCELPEDGNYRPLSIGGYQRHYAGVSVVSPVVADAAFEGQIAGGMFTSLRREVEKKGYFIEEYYYSGKGKWTDMGETELFRRNTLASGSFVHPSARVDSHAVLEGCYSIGPYCIINNDALIRDSVMLEGAQILEGQKAVNTVLPWFYQRSSM